jgi:hypothetical protein
VRRASTAGTTSGRCSRLRPTSAPGCGGSLAAAEQIAGPADRELLPADLAELHLPARV